MPLTMPLTRPYTTTRAWRSAKAPPASAPPASPSHGLWVTMWVVTAPKAPTSMVPSRAMLTTPLRSLSTPPVAAAA